MKFIKFDVKWRLIDVKVWFARGDVAVFRVRLRLMSEPRNWYRGPNWAIVFSSAINQVVITLIEILHEIPGQGTANLLLRSSIVPGDDVTHADSTMKQKFVTNSACSSKERFPISGSIIRSFFLVSIFHLLWFCISFQIRN